MVEEKAKQTFCAALFPKFQTISDLVSRLVLVIWWGGLTFYAAIVVPTGSELIGSYEQGMVTQSVTHWLNFLCLSAVLLLCLSAIANNRRLNMIAVLTIAISLIVMFFVHRQLDWLMDNETSDYDRFYSVHRVYLIATTVQWLAGLWLVYESCVSGFQQKS